MNRKTQLFALLLALPVSTILVGCDRGEDTDRQALEREALERELELALQPDTAVEPELSDVALEEPEAEPESPAATSPAPARRTTAQPQRQQPQPRPTQPAPPPASQPAPRPSGPRMETLSVPAGTRFAMTMNEEISTRTASVGQTVTATLSEPIRAADGTMLVPAGATVRGRVTQSSKSGHAGQQPQLRVDFTSVVYGGRTYSIDATTLDAEARLVSRSSTAEKAAKVGGGAAVGAVLGQVLGRNTKSTVAGAAVGAAAGTAVAMGTDDVDAVIPAGSRVTVRLDSGMQVTREVG